MYDRLLVKPMALDLCSALAEAGGGDRAFWSGQVAELRDHREGRRFWPEREAGLSWWTDHEGRRHFRVQGEDPLIVCESYPPIVDLYPDVCIRRGLGDETPSWVLLCGCGAVQPADAPTGWMGPCCIACHALAPDARPRHGRILDLGEAAGVEPLADGFAVAEHHGDTGRVRLLDAEGITVEVREGIRVDPPFAVSPDLRHVVSAGARRLRVRSLVAGELSLDQPQEEADEVQFSPEGTTVAVIGPKRSVLYDFDRETGVMTPRYLDRAALPEIDQTFRQVAWSPDDRTLALATAEELRAERDGLKLPFVEAGSFPSRTLAFIVDLLQDPLPSPLPPPRNRSLHRTFWLVAAEGLKMPRVWFSPDGSVLWCIRAVPAREHNVASPTLYLSSWRWEHDVWMKLADRHIDGVTTCRFRTSGRWMAVARRYVGVHDLETGRCIGRMGLSASVVTTPPRFTAGGRSLILPHEGRFRVVPWAVLLSEPA